MSIFIVIECAEKINPSTFCKKKAMIFLYDAGHGDPQDRTDEQTHG